MLRAVLALLAVFAFSQAASAQGSRQAFEAYKDKVRSVISAAVHQEVGAGRALIAFQVSASGKVTLEWVKAKDKWLKRRLLKRLASLRVPPPPAWSHPPLLFDVAVVYGG